MANYEQISIDQLSERNPSSFNKPDFVTIKVGPVPQKTYVICKGLICRLSPFFAAAFNGKFSEATTRSMSLEDVDISTFDLIDHWLRTKTIASRPRQTLKSIALTWTLAERFLMEGMQKSVEMRILDLFASIKEPHAEIVELCEYIYTADMEEGRPDSIQDAFDFLAGEVASKDYVGFEKWLEQIPRTMVRNVLAYLDEKQKQWTVSSTPAPVGRRRVNRSRRGRDRELEIIMREFSELAAVEDLEEKYKLIFADAVIPSQASSTGWKNEYYKMAKACRALNVIQ